MFSYLSFFTLARHRLTRRFGCSLGFLASLAIVLGSVAPAQAALFSTGACNTAALSQPLVRWGDANLYQLVPGGDFERSPSSWTLSGGAQRVAGSEPYGATGSVGGYSLALPAGATAQSPFTCVNISYPTFRLFARNNGLASTVLVQVVYKTPLGSISLPLGIIALSSEWQPTPPILTGSLVGSPLSGGTSQIALRFTALTGSSRIDDVFLDPHGH